MYHSAHNIICVLVFGAERGPWAKRKIPPGAHNSRLPSSLPSFDSLRLSDARGSVVLREALARSSLFPFIVHEVYYRYYARHACGCVPAARVRSHPLKYCKWRSARNPCVSSHIFDPYSVIARKAKYAITWTIVVVRERGEKTGPKPRKFALVSCRSSFEIRRSGRRLRCRKPDNGRAPLRITARVGERIRHRGMIFSGGGAQRASRRIARDVAGIVGRKFALTAEQRR